MTAIIQEYNRTSVAQPRPRQKRSSFQNVLNLTWATTEELEYGLALVSKETLQLGHGTGGATPWLGDPGVASSSEENRLGVQSGAQNRGFLKIKDPLCTMPEPVVTSTLPSLVRI